MVTRWLFGDQLGPHFVADHDGPGATEGILAPLSRGGTAYPRPQALR